MALYKELIQDDGVATCYHRILYHQTTPNRQTSIAVLSYVNEKAREAEKNNIFGSFKDGQCLQISICFSVCHGTVIIRLIRDGFYVW